jgi:DNA-binding CsgD family transcriptional regulator
MFNEAWEDEFEEEEETWGLTERELQVVKLVGTCMTYSEIAEELELGYETVKTYAGRVRKKLGLKSKVAIALWAKEKGLIDE